MDENLCENLECEVNLSEGDFVISDEWLEEIHRRVADIDAGRMEMIPAEQVFLFIGRALQQ